MVRTRFAPSPTGYLHVGGLRTALYSFLIARRNSGKFLLRIEDTDRERFVEGGVENILRSLYWSKITPDEGVVLNNDTIGEKGDHGPYIQSARLQIYKKYAEELLKNGHAYYCFCTPERLVNLRKEQEKNKVPTGYDQHCLINVKPEEANSRISAGERHVVRLKMPKEGETTFRDLIRGEVSFKNKLIDDQVLIKSDGFPTYHLAVVVDDHEMDITHVIRGEEWISSTPKHIQLYKYFGWKAPEFAHLPLLLNPDKSKLSKRQGDVAVSDYKNKGYLPEALVNFVAFLGWNPGDDREVFSLDDLVKEFSLEKINKTGAVFNVDKLNWFNREYLKKMSLEKIMDYAETWLKEFTGKIDQEIIKKIVDKERHRVTTLDELTKTLSVGLAPADYESKLLVWKKGSLEEAKTVLGFLREFLEKVAEEDWNEKKLEEVLKKWIEEKGFGTGNVLWPMRVALSGEQNSLGPFELAEIIGKKQTIQRIAAAVHKMS